MINLIKLEHYKQMPWKNGKGVTEEIIRVDKSLGDSFLWRLSKASVSEDGFFSNFSGYQRILSILDKGRMALSIDNKESQLLNPFQAFTFSGDSTVSCHLLDGELMDFNLIYDPKFIMPSFHWLVECNGYNAALSGEWLLFNMGNDLQVNANEKVYLLNKFDTLHIIEPTITLKIENATSITCCLISIHQK